MEKNKDLLIRIKQLAAEILASDFNQQSVEAFLNEIVLYADLNIPCPFLMDNICSIYEVRPRGCASIFATTPSEWCNPLSPNASKVNYHISLPDHPTELPFYYKNIYIPVFLLHMPDVVYGILINGVLYLSKMPGLEDFARDFMSDPQAGAVLQRFRTSRS